MVLRAKDKKLRKCLNLKWGWCPWPDLNWHEIALHGF